MSEAFFQHAFYIGNYFTAFSMRLLLLLTVYVSTELVFGEEAWITHADNPGGAAAYLVEYASVWYQTMGSTASVALQLMTDALLIYRCFIVWNNYAVLIFPCILWVGTLGLGIVELAASGAPNGDLFVGLAEDIGLAYFSTTIGLNVLATGLICGRILHLQMRTYASDRTRRALRYSGTIPIIVESAVPYTLSGIAFLVSYGIGSPISVLWLSIYVMFTCISPQLIILRTMGGVDENAIEELERQPSFDHKSPLNSVDDRQI
ncbi:hypothetical protein B0H21DRAFT_747388 [Amylocystis lapponica]|nr:hypothetical protein B0H21DRAFT_747388 [Amylocystis lapponica]